MNSNPAILRTLAAVALCGGLVAASLHAAPDSVPAPGGWAQAKGRRVLYFTKSAGFEHSVVKRPAAGQLSHSERILTELGQRHGFDVTCTKDGGVFTPDQLAKYDVLVFYTSGNLLTTGTDKTPAMTPRGKAALLEAVRQGKGFVGLHAANDSFHPEPDHRFVAFGERVDPYIAMLGGEFIRHGPQQIATARVVDPAFPGCEGLADKFELRDEWYTFKDFAPDLHVIHALETKGMKGIDYRRASFPCTWARRHGQGRVFYTGLGHREDVWTNPLFQNLLLGGIGWAAGNVDAAIPANLDTATPGYREIQPKDEPKP
ncbi:MAG: ThuA domain-containing protein [Verrucomicrobia bacterium]|nr:ThuA domain-containing protein [Verrucomicrobiota bacterium]